MEEDGERFVRAEFGVAGGSTLVYVEGAVLLTSARSIFFAGAVFVVGTLGAACRHTETGAPAPSVLAVGWAGCAAVVRDGGFAAREDREGAAGPGSGRREDVGAAEVVCELGAARTLRLALPPDALEVAIAADGRSLAPRATEGGPAADGGGSSARLPVSVDVPVGAGVLTVTARVAGRPARFALRIAPARTFPFAEEARALRAKGDLAHARELAAPHENATDLTERAVARALLGRLALAEGRAEAAFPLLRDAIALDRQVGRISDAADDSFALAFALHQRSRRYDEAHAVLDAASAEAAVYPEGHAREPYYRGILASETGDRRRALTLLREAEARARALGMSRLRRNARAALALEMQVLGRARASLDILRELEAEPGATPCERVEVQNDIGWGAILAAEAEGVRASDARGPLERAVSVEGCADAYLRSFAFGNLARVALDEGDVDGAAAHLVAARTAVTEPRGIDRLGWLDLDGRIALARGQAREALRRFDDERALAHAAVLVDNEWSALVGRAEALEALGKPADAAEALLAAEALVERAMLLVPLGEGRGAFVADRSRSARRAIELLVALRRLEDAARVARRSNARLLESVARALRIERLSPEQRARWETAVSTFRAARTALDVEAANDWKLPADRVARVIEARRDRDGQLRAALEGAMAVLADGSDGARAAREAGDGADPIVPGDVELVIHPSGKRGWAAFALGSERTLAYAVPAPDGVSPAELGRALFEPAAALLESASRVRVRAYGRYRALDFHALPYRERRDGREAPLIAKLPVEYAVGFRAEPRPATSGPRLAVVVGDPTGDLPRALTEAEDASRALAAGAFQVRALLRRAATSVAVREALQGADLLHYAGHGVFGGVEGFESALPLAEGGRLALADVLALAPAPRDVVLSGCDAARSDGDVEGLGLAQAFVVAGAEAVVAPVRPVPDELAARFSAALHAARAAEAGASVSLAQAAREAARRLREGEPSGSIDWAAFRVMSR